MIGSKPNVAVILLGLVLSLTCHVRIAASQAVFESTIAGQPIPKNYQSWSLFLICNPQWLLAENESKLAGLHQQFRSFGQAIGAKHLAVWFWKRPPAPGGPVAENIDVDRSAAFCTKLKLLPSRSPYVVVTTVYPDLDQETLKPEVLIELNNLTPPDIGNLLNTLADQLLVQGLRQATFDTEQYWNAWKRSAESMRDFLGRMVKKVKLTINTPFVKLEVEGGSE
jgi:hypothetical protein